jgi:hypothetical protein
VAAVKRTSCSLIALAVLFACASDDGDGAEGSPSGESTSATHGAESSGETPTTAPASSQDSSGELDSSAGSESTGGFGDVPEFGATLTVIATVDDGLNIPRDLEFAPDHPDQLWTANAAIHGAVILFDPGTAEQTAEVRVDAYGQHFMAFVSSFAFGEDNFFSSCQESRDEWNVGPQRPDDFMGPSLWTADLDIFAMVNQAFPPDPLEGSHLDMLHQSPLCMGIAHDQGNAYWTFDGSGGHIVYYDFMQDHGPGGSSHVDGVIRRYLNAVVTRVPEIPGHMVLDPDSRRLYIADTGTGRVMWLDTESGASNGDLANNWDGATEYTGWDGATFEPLVEGLGQPSGLALHDGRVFVSDHQSAEIIAFDLDGTELGRMPTDAVGLMGITIGPDGKLYYADGFGNEIVRVDP